MRTMLAALVAAALAATAIPFTAAQQGQPRQRRQQQVIVPGERVGNLTIRMTPQQILQAAPPGHTRTAYSRQDPEAMRKACLDEPLVVYEWSDEGLWFSTEPDERRVRVLGVYGATPDFVTDKGIELFDPIDAALKAHGSGAERLVFPNCEVRVLVYRYNEKGIQFEAASRPGSPADRRIFRIGIFTPGFFTRK